MKFETTVTTRSFTEVVGLTMQPILIIEYCLQRFALCALVFAATGCSANSELISMLERWVLGECLFLETFSVDEMVELYQLSPGTMYSVQDCHLISDNWLLARGIVGQQRYNYKAAWIKYLPSPCHRLKLLREEYRLLFPEQPPHWPTELPDARCP